MIRRNARADPAEITLFTRSNIGTLRLEPVGVGVIFVSDVCVSIRGCASLPETGLIRG